MDIISKDIRTLLTKYTFEISTSEEIQDLTCIICRKLMLDACITFCNCQYCYQCIYNHLLSGNGYCCGFTDQCKNKPLVFDESLFRNSTLDIKILGVKVICPKQGCIYSAKLSQINEHIDSCLVQKFECPYLSIGCDNHAHSVDSISVHNNDDYLKHTRLLIEWMNNVKNDVKNNESKIKTLNTDIGDKDNRILALENDARDKQNTIVTLQRELQLKDIQMVQLVNEIKEQKKETKLLNEQFKNYKKKVDSIDSKLKGAEKDKKPVILNENSITSKIETMTKSIDNALIRINEVETRLENLDSGTNARVSVGMTVFKVDNFEIMKTPDDGIVSPCFYSHTNGYKLKLLIYPGGCDDGAGMHVSVYVVICNGEYDDILPWPCKHAIKVSIINQLNDDTHYSKTVDYFTASDTARMSFYKPNSKDNNAYGYTQFISHTDLKEIKGLIVNDSIVIKCVVNMPI